MTDIYTILENLGIQYTQYDHPPLFTVEEAEKHYGQMPGGHTKNLFLRNKKGDTHYLVVVEATKNINLNELRKMCGESKLSFASPERLEQYLGLKPGSVSPLGLANNTANDVQVFIDQDLWKYDAINCHPNVNTATIAITPDNLKKFLDWTGNDWKSVAIPER